MTINEVREQEGLPPVKGGDQIFAPLNLAPIASTEDKSKSNKRDDIKVKVRALTRIERVKNIPKERIKEEIKGFLLNEIKKIKTQLEDERYKSYWEGFVKRAGNYEKKIKDITKKYFAKQEKEILKKFERKQITKSVELIDIDWDNQTQLYLNMITPIFEEMIKEQGNKATEELLGEMRFDASNPAIKEFIDEYALKLAKGINETTRKELTEKITQAIEQNEGLDKIKEDIVSVFKNAKKNRAEMIARTESIRISNFASQEAFRQAGIQKKQWLTAFDERTCQRCASMNGMIVDVTDSFGPVSLPPLHPNCRCTIIPVFNK